MNFDICLCSKGFESWPSFTIWSIGYPTGLDHWTPRLTARHLWSWSTSKRVTWVPSMVATSSTTSWGQGMTWWIIWIYLDWFIYIIIYIYIYTYCFLVFFQISNRWLPHGYPMVTPLFSHALEFTPRTVRKTRYARKEKYLEDPDAGVLNLEESGGSPDQVGNIKGKQPGKQPPNRSHPKKRIFRSDCCDGLHPNMEIRLQSDAEVNCRNLGVWSKNISIQSLYISNII